MSESIAEAARPILDAIRSLPFEANGECYACGRSRDSGGHDPDCDVLQLVDDVSDMLGAYADAMVREAVQPTAIAMLEALAKREGWVKMPLPTLVGHQDMLTVRWRTKEGIFLYERHHLSQGTMAAISLTRDEAEALLAGDGGTG